MVLAREEEAGQFAARAAGGALLCLLFCVLAVALRGIRWDETYEHALIITRMTPYPEGHPFFRYVRNVFSGQSYFSAAILWMWPSPVFLCGLRNVLQLLFTVLPPFFLAAVYTRRVRWGLVAGVFVLLGVHTAFQSYYPIVIWPSFYSVGQVGAGYALLTLACFMGGARRCAWFLLGLMPMVHVGQVPVLGLVAGLALLHAVWQGEWGFVRRALTWSGAGLAVCVGFWLVQRGFHVAVPATGPYVAEGDSRAIWSAYSALHDVHRFLPRYGPFGHTNILLIASLLLSAGLARLEKGPAPVIAWSIPSGPGAWILLYTAGVAGVVWGVMLVHHVLGEHVPFLLIGWMPYRLANHLPPLLIAGGLFVLLRRGNAGTWFLLLLLAFAALLPLFQWMLPSGLFQRYVGARENILFALSGGAFMACALQLRHDRAFLLPWLAFSAAAFAALALYHQFGACCAALGAVLVLAGGKLTDARGLRWIPSALALVLLTLPGELLFQESTQKAPLPVAPVQTRIVEYLAARGEDKAILLTPYWDIEWLSHTKHPIMADYQTAHLMTYLPGLAPSIKKLYQDIYGVDVDGPAPWSLEAWRSRAPEAWRALGKAYNFQYVVSPKEYPLQLTPVLSGEQHTLYRVGDGAGE